MSKESLEQFLNQVEQSEELQTRIGEAVKIDELIALGAEHGCEFSAEDLAENAELSDEDLGAVAGGGREERQKRRLMRRMERAAKKLGVIGPDGTILWDTTPSGSSDTTRNWDDGSGDPTKLN